MIETAYRDSAVVPPLAGYRGFTLAEPLEETLRRCVDAADTVDGYRDDTTGEATAMPVDPEAARIVDVGSLWLQVPEGARLQDADETGDPCSVQLVLPSGRISLSVLVAPETGALWPEMADEVATARNDAGATVTSEQGDWGQEVAARSNGELSLFIGMDGPGWMLYGVAAGPEERSAELGDALRELMRDSVVSAALAAEPSNLPARTALPLSQPESAPVAELPEPSEATEASRSADLFRDPMEPRKPLDAVPTQDWMPTQWSPPKHDLASPTRVAVDAANAPTEPTLGEPGWLTEPEWVSKPEWLTLETQPHSHASRSHRPVPAGMSALIGGAILVLGTASMLVIASGARHQPAAAAADIVGEPATALTISGVAPTAPRHHIAEHPASIESAPVLQTPDVPHHAEPAKSTHGAPGQLASSPAANSPTANSPAAKSQAANSQAANSQAGAHTPAAAGTRTAPTAGTGQGHKPASSSTGGTAERRTGSESHRAGRSHGESHSSGRSSRSDDDSDDDLGGGLGGDLDVPDLLGGLTDGLIGGIG